VTGVDLLDERFAPVPAERERSVAYRHLESSAVQGWISEQLEGRSSAFAGSVR